jgi:hypothetical protein
MARSRRQVVHVKARAIQRLFNDGNYWTLAQTGQIRQVIQRESHPAPAFLPHCTKSQMVAYYDQGGAKIALVHQYLQPDGTLGASGLPDPKRLLHQGVLYFLDAK